MGKVQEKKEALIQKLSQEMEVNGGLMRTSQLYELPMDYRKIQQFVEEGILERIKSGYYGMGFSQKSEQTMVSELFSDGVLCLETALFYRGYCKNRPVFWQIAVDKNTSKSRFKMNYPPVKPYYLEPDILMLGAEKISMGDGNMYVYNIERLVCDCLKFEEKLERGVLKQLLRQYIEEPQKDIQKLMEYARIRRVTQKVQNRIGVWL
ncbi:MAG: type IV toxin-antitoxin system AbiEi family antitoxin domain-containing protein [Lachnospiraceae bacterium]|nr:type IV toxin-antitoxin system AbiEi family antitoxin domain-containing protein [Lachnospiraceae bacterium]